MTNVTIKIGVKEQRALDWLIQQGGSGTFDEAGQQITANDETLSYKREIWVKLRDAQRIEFYNDGRATPFGGVRVITNKDRK